LADYTKSLEALFDSIATSILDDIAVEGLEILRSILADAGFLHSEYLKNYELSSRIEDDAVVYQILIDFESLDDESQVAVQEVETPVEDPTDPNSYSIPTLPSRVFARARRILGQTGGKRDARRPSRRNNDARRPIGDARRDARTNSFDRQVARDVSAPAPRKMRVDRQGKLVVAFRKELKEENGQYQYPSGDFDGIIKQFISELESLLLEKFAPKLEEIIKRYMA